MSVHVWLFLTNGLKSTFSSKYWRLTSCRRSCWNTSARNEMRLSSFSNQRNTASQTFSSFDTFKLSWQIIDINSSFSRATNSSRRQITSNSRKINCQDVSFNCSQPRLWARRQIPIQFSAVVCSRRKLSHLPCKHCICRRTDARSRSSAFSIVTTSSPEYAKDSTFSKIEELMSFR